jgi:hypothetical protein
VDVDKGLTGFVDYLMSRSSEQLEIEAPVIIVGEAKRDNLNEGLGQCIAEMVAAQLFNQGNQVNIPRIYGAVSNGTQWRFLQLDGSTVAIDLMDYALPPVDQILGFLVWMVQEG